VSINDKDAMAAINSVNKVLITRLVQIFGGRLKDWADEIQKSTDTVVAISRKGPRLLELMVREGLLPESVLSRVIAEQALPFLTQNNNAGFVVVDDAMTYGTTFSRIYKLTEQTQIRCGGNEQKLTGIPFAVGQEANSKYRELVTKHFLDLDTNQIASFVNNEMLAFRLLGKPYDIEHPMLTWAGDFTDTYKLEAALGQITELLGGQKASIDTSVPTATGNVQIRRWTILLPTNPRPNLYPLADFEKLRIYLNPEKDRLIVAAIRPLSLSKDDMDYLGKILPAPLNNLWREVAGKVDTEATGLMAKISSCSLAMWANFLSAMVLLRDIRATFLEVFETSMSQLQMYGPRREDLQYIIGPTLSLHAETNLTQFLECINVDLTPFSCSLSDHASEVVDEKIPSQYAEDYAEKLSSAVNCAQHIEDVLQAIFYTQHTAIELISRSGNRDNDVVDIERLEFGITFSKLRQTVQIRFPDATDIDIHECLDKMIDNGAIVPRYLNMAAPGKPEIWVRTFRVGEGTVHQVAHTVRLLFEKLSEAIGSKDLSPLVFEKFCALALCVANDVETLKPLQSLGISKLFHLYGARPALILGKKAEFLTEWAVNQNILNRVKSDTDELKYNYSLQHNIETSYPARECQWDEDVKDGLEDLAKLVAAIYKDKKTSSMLVALTSTATKDELQQALEGELQLWLSDNAASVYRGLNKLTWLAEIVKVKSPSADQLESVNSVLSSTANFTAQVKVKTELAEKRLEIYKQIDELAATETSMKRCWRKLRTTLDGRINSESNTSGLREITSVLRIAHFTNNILRDLLTLAGYKHTRSAGLGQSLNQLQNLLDDREKIDYATKTIFSATDSKQDIASFITAVKNLSLDDFSEVFPEVRKLILEIAGRCEQVLRTYGIDKLDERFDVISPPRYIMMWDIKNSTAHESRDPIESLIVNANRQIKETFRSRIMDFHADSKDDGNGFVCESFTDVLTAFQILNDVFHAYPFRAGCDVNLQGKLNYYPKTKTLGGRAFEYAARVAAFYKELKINPAIWSGSPVPPEPTDTSYMIVSEFAKRYAEQEKAWPSDKTYKITELEGMYEARVNASFPVSLTILQP
jgi:hypothetical protein